MSVQLGSLRSRLTPGQQRRRAARLARRAEVTRSPGAPVWTSSWVVRTGQAWNESLVGRRLSQLRAALGHYGARTIRHRVNAYREHLIACAKAASIERCTYQHVTPARMITVRDQKTGETHTRRTEARTGDPCGGRLKDRRQRVNGALVVDQVCLACGRAA
jgi:hypothetical protein